MVAASAAIASAAANVATAAIAAIAAIQRLQQLQRHATKECATIHLSGWSAGLSAWAVGLLCVLKSMKFPLVLQCSFAKP